MLLWRGHATLSQHHQILKCFTSLCKMIVCGCISYNLRPTIVHYKMYIWVKSQEPTWWWCVCIVSSSKLNEDNERSLQTSLMITQAQVLGKSRKGEGDPLLCQPHNIPSALLQYKPRSSVQEGANCVGCTGMHRDALCASSYPWEGSGLMRFAMLPCTVLSASTVNRVEKEPFSTKYVQGYEG